MHNEHLAYTYLELMQEKGMKELHPKHIHRHLYKQFQRKGTKQPYLEQCKAVYDQRHFLPYTSFLKVNLGKYKKIGTYKLIILLRSSQLAWARSEGGLLLEILDEHMEE